MKASFNSFIVFFVKKRRLFLLDVSFSGYQKFANQVKYIKYKKKNGRKRKRLRPFCILV